MIKINKNGKITFDIGSFHLHEYLDNDIMELIEDFNYGLGTQSPILLRIETPINEYYIVINIKELYIIDVNKEKLITEKISLDTFAKLLYNDFHRQQKEIINYNSNYFEDKDEIKKILSLNLSGLDILIKDNNFIYKKGNLTHKTLEALNNALYLHSIGCVYDKIENVETFRLFGYDKTYVIAITNPLHKNKNYKQKISLDIINEPLTEIAKSVYEKINQERKLKTTKILLEQLKDNLVEYGVKL